MAPRDQARQLYSNMLGLGRRRLAALAIVGLTVFGAVALGAMYLGHAEQEVLYSGLERSDIGRIGTTLNDAGITFDVNAEGNTVLVAPGDARRARMLLAEQGLPTGASGGNGLDDGRGSLGLTSFMQEITRVRALEGELARTIQVMEGVRAARVHLVLPDEGSFRRDSQPPSASVILRLDTPDATGMARAIQHLVAGAVQGMTPAEVTVLTADGALIGGGGGDMTVPSNMIGLEQTVGRRIRENIRRTLTPYLGLDNFQVSVAARLNADQRQVSETIFDPESQTERSTRVVRLNEIAQNRSGETPTSVAENLPESEPAEGSGEQSSNQSERREELTNYEISSKTITTIGDGYGIERLSVAILIDRAQLSESLGENPEPAAIEKRLDEIRVLVSSAAGLSEARGDTLALTAVNFLGGADEMTPVPPPTMLEVLARHAGTFINAGTILLVSLLVIWFGLRPATRALLARSGEARAAEAATLAGAEGTTGDQASLPPGARPNLLGDLANQVEHSPQKRLAQIVEFDEERAASLLREWVHQEERA